MQLGAVSYAVGGVPVFLSPSAEWVQLFGLSSRKKRILRLGVNRNTRGKRRALE